MSINSVPNEILEEIILKARGDTFINCNLTKYVLVCRRWALIANHHIWKEVRLDDGSWDKSYKYEFPSYKDSGFAFYKDSEFPFYRHITKPGYTFGKYILKLELEFSRLWPICIIKMLRRCPNIVDLTIRDYQYRDVKGRGKVVNFLEEIQRLLPNLKRLDIINSHRELANIEIEKLIENRKDLQILASRNCKECYYHIERYNGKEWTCKGCEYQLKKN